MGQLVGVERDTMQLSHWPATALTNLACAWARLSDHTRHSALVVPARAAAAALPLVESFVPHDLARLVGCLCSLGLLDEAWQLYARLQRATLGYIAMNTESE